MSRSDGGRGRESPIAAEHPMRLADDPSVQDDGKTRAVKMLRVAPDPELIESSIRLRHFITDWLGAQRKFVSGIPHRLRDLTAIQPHDLRMSYTGVLGDASCTCRLYDGAASITLSADMLKLSFKNVPPAARETVFKVIHIGLEFLASEFSENEVAWLSLNTSQDVRASGDEIKAYLKQFEYEGAVAVAEQEQGTTYLPSVRVTLKFDGRWLLHRLVEETMPNADGLFISTSYYVPDSGLEAFDGLEQTIARLCEMADRAVGLNRGSE